MASWSYSDISTLVTPGGTITFNASSGDTLLVDPDASSGLGVSQLRTPIFNKGQTDGYNILPFFEEGQHLVLAGVVRILSAGDDAGYKAARDSLLTDTRTKLKTILAANGTLTVGGDTLIVRCEQLITPSGGFFKSFVMGLVSASPA